MAECKKCGCNDVVAAGVSIVNTTIYHCNYCESDTWSQAKIDAVVFHVLLCPFCRSRNHFVTSTQKPIRFHHCRSCGENFKSYEKES
jgi:hypothetical protein